jgi:hypothetical protein
MATRRGVTTTLVLLGATGVAFYPVVALPLLGQAQRERPEAQPLEPGFSKGSLWKESEKKQNK